MNLNYCTYWFFLFILCIIVSLSLLYSYHSEIYSSELAELIPLLSLCEKSYRCSDRLHDCFIILPDVIRTCMLTVSFQMQLDPGFFLLSECFLFDWMIGWTLWIINQLVSFFFVLFWVCLSILFSTLSFQCSCIIILTWSEPNTSVMV